MRNILKKVMSFLIVISFVFMLYSVGNSIVMQYKKYQVSSEIEQVVALMKDTNTTSKHSLDYYKKYYQNDNIVGSLKIEGTGIETLLVKGNDNEYYLNHSIRNEYDIIGSIFVDYRTDLNSKQINIYGHNSNVYDVIFKKLENYLDNKYYSDHKYIELWDGDKKSIYEIFSVQIVSNDYEHYDVDADDWIKHIDTLNNSIYTTNTKATPEDEILIIQTCLYNPVNSLLLINAKKV
jgi:sortase B